jgi:molybdenum ABC transporter molybdate-binding protein
MPGAFARLGPELAHAFTASSGQRIEFAAFRPSGLLATAILGGEAADVYVSANVVWMRRLQRAGIVAHWSTLARNRLCLIALGSVCVDGLADLTRPGLRVVAPQAQTDPCGAYVEQLWRRTGLLRAMHEKQSRGELVRSVGSGDLPGFLRDARAEVGMLYVSEARALEFRTIELPPEHDLHERVRFVVAAMTPAAHPFVRWLLGSDAQARLATAGFVPAATADESATRTSWAFAGSSRTSRNSSA